MARRQLAGTKKKATAAAATLEPDPEGADVADIEDLAAGAPVHAAAVHSVDLKRVREQREQLVTWYRGQRRRLPWRGDAPPFLTTPLHTEQSRHRNSAQKTKSGQHPVVGAMDAFCIRQSSKQKEPKEPKEPNEQEQDDEDAKPKVETETVKSETAPRRVTPYETWVSEIMLQQTRVDTVVAYFVKWLAAFPDVAALARASEEQVNAHWAGLGYYRRARMLHAGAQFVLERFQGELPATVEELLTIPGIGPYTAGAIASIAFQQREPLVDGNVIRVVARLRAVGADPKHKPLIKFAWQTARELVEDCDQPGDLNQALMELGATVCTVQNPRCGDCPVRSSCLAYDEAQRRGDKPTDDSSPCELCDLSRWREWSGCSGEGVTKPKNTTTNANDPFSVTRYPLKTTKAAPRSEVICVAVVAQPQRDGGHPHSEDQPAEPPAEALDGWRFLMTRRPRGGLLAGQWEFLHVKTADGDAIPPFSQRQALMTPHILAAAVATSAATATATASSTTIDADALERRDLGQMLHIFSHVRHHMGIELVQLAAAQSDGSASYGSGEADGDGDGDAVQWLSVREMHARGITTGVRKILQRVEAAMRAPVPAATSAKKRRASAQSKPNASASADTKKKKKNPKTDGSHVADAPPARTRSLRSFFSS